MIDKENDCVWIGGDSLGSNGYTKAVEGQHKVFRNKVFKNVIMGSTSTFRHIDLLKYSDKLFDELDLYKNTKIDHEYMVTKFIPNIITLFKDGIVFETEINRGANFIVGVGNKFRLFLTVYHACKIIVEHRLVLCALLGVKAAVNRK